jgi:hypothetical protein
LEVVVHAFPLNAGRRLNFFDYALEKLGIDEVVDNDVRERIGSPIIVRAFVGQPIKLAKVGFV